MNKYNFNDNKEGKKRKLFLNTENIGVNEYPNDRNNSQMTIV
jgi:hypothetical protein